MYISIGPYLGAALEAPRAPPGVAISPSPPPSLRLPVVILLFVPELPYTSCFIQGECLAGVTSTRAENRTMDPVSAIGLASSILTFVDFATKLVSGTYEAYKTGTIGKTSDAQTVLQDLRRVSEELHHGTFDGAQSHHKELLKLADDCLKLSNELETLLDKLIRSAKDKNALWSSIRVSWLSIWKQKEVQGLERKLEKHRSQIILRLNQLIL